jgi:hypothetical protein
MITFEDIGFGLGRSGDIGGATFCASNFTSSTERALAGASSWEHWDKALKGRLLGR